MTNQQKRTLDLLVQLARQKPCPLETSDRRFVLSLVNVRDVPLTSIAAAKMDGLAAKHLNHGGPNDEQSPEPDIPEADDDGD